MIRYIGSLFLLLQCYMWTGCGDGKILLPRANGKEGELMIVVDQKYWKNHPIGDSLREIFQRPYKGLPQIEPEFKVYRVFPSNFSSTFRQTQAIFMVNLDPALGDIPAYLEKSVDVWAEGQIIITIKAGTEAQLIAGLSKLKEHIIRIFHEEDQKRLTRGLKVTETAELTGYLKDKWGMYMSLPQGFFKNVEDTQFVYFVHDGVKRIGGLEQQLTRGIWIHRFPYTDSQTFTRKFVAAKRDSITSKYIEGADSSYMVIEPLYALDSNAINLQGNYAIETRGLWRMEGVFMGGGFINYTFLHPPTNTVYMLDAFIFAPNQDKRRYVMQLEAILRTAKVF